MKKSLISILLILGLSGCVVIPKIPPFPDAPQILLEPAEALTPLNKETIELSDIIENANENAAKYYKLREKYLAWQEWYHSQKELREQMLK